MEILKIILQPKLESLNLESSSNKETINLDYMYTIQLEKAYEQINSIEGNLACKTFLKKGLSIISEQVD